MFVKLVVRQSSIVCIGILSLLIVKKKGHNVIFLMYVAIKIASLRGCKNIILISLISAAVAYNDYNIQSDRLSS